MTNLVLKESWIKFDENLASMNLSNAYPLTKILEHYIYCHVFCKPEYDMIHMDEEFLLTDQCTVKGTLYYSKDHVIKVINNNSLMQEVIDGATRYVNCLNSIVEDDGGVPGCMKTYLKPIDSTERKIICNIIKKSVLDKVLIVPKMLVLKYFLQIESSSASKNDCKKIFAVYFYTVLFMLFGDKKSDAEKIKKVAKSNNFYNDLISEIKAFVSTSKMATTHLIAISRWNSNFENEDLQYKCKSLATIYNYFKLENNVVSVTSIDNLNSFLNNEEKYSVVYCVLPKAKEVTHMAKITIKELYYGDKYAVMSEVFKTMYLVSPNKAGVDEQTALELEIVRQTLIATEKMKQNGDCIAEEELGGTVAICFIGGNNEKHN